VSKESSNHNIDEEERKNLNLPNDMNGSFHQTPVKVKMKSNNGSSQNTSIQQDENLDELEFATA
jgi:hypothetical protein